MPPLPATATISGAGPSDAALVVAARAGERWAAEALFRRYARVVNRLALRLVGRDVDVDDLVQESFAQAFASLSRLQEPASFGPWLSAIVARTAYKTLRRRQLLRRFGLWKREEPVDVDSVIAPNAPPEAVAELRAVYRVLPTLPARIRVPLVLHRVEGLSLEEVATIIDASIATVKRRIAEAEDALSSSSGRGQ